MSSPGLPATLACDLGRLWNSLAATFTIGRREEGGVRRLALSEPEGQMRDAFVAEAERAGLAVSVDAVGNIFARRDGTEPGLAPVLVGSHLDSQVAAGPFDGPLGVFAGLEIVRTLDQHGIQTLRGIELVSWTNEEGPRFAPPMMGSGAFAGALAEADVLATEDPDGISVAEALEAIGYLGSVPCGPRELDSYFELHIEQSPTLDRSTCDVGIVTGGYPTQYLGITVTGEPAHSGPTPMESRRNALVAAARIVIAIDDAAMAHGPDGKSTCTGMDVWPNRPGMIPAAVELRADLRHPDPAALEHMVATVETACREFAERCRVSVDCRRTHGFGGVSFDRDLIELLEDEARRLGTAVVPLLSQAGHDAYNLCRVCPSALIFCPCTEGRSHNPAENVEPQRLEASVNLMLNAVHHRAQTA
jgi:N-carbamoyl-L-amino-acid hydrolase